MTTRYPRKPSRLAVPFGLCTIGPAAPPVPDVICGDCTQARRMQASAWRGCAQGHAPHRAYEPHACRDWQPAGERP